MGGRPWHHNEIDALQRMWPLHSLEEIHAAIPGRTTTALRGCAFYRKFKRFPEARRHQGRKAIRGPTVITQLRRAREHQGLTRPQLAKKIGVAWISISKWESCWNKPKFHLLLAWAQALGYEISIRPVKFEQTKSGHHR